MPDCEAGAVQSSTASCPTTSQPGRRCSCSCKYRQHHRVCVCASRGPSQEVAEACGEDLLHHSVARDDGCKGWGEVDALGGSPVGQHALLQHTGLPAGWINHSGRGKERVGGQCTCAGMDDETCGLVPVVRAKPWWADLAQSEAVGGGGLLVG